MNNIIYRNINGKVGLILLSKQYLIDLSVSL